VGQPNDADKGHLLRGASALPFPIDWPEPFGLVMIEAMACGSSMTVWRASALTERCLRQRQLRFVLGERVFMIPSLTKCARIAVCADGDRRYASRVPNAREPIPFDERNSQFTTARLSFWVGFARPPECARHSCRFLPA